MDFVVSKVAMSVCALMVVCVLEGCMDPSGLADPGSELGMVVRELCDLVDRMTLSGACSSLAWTVPCLSSGQSLRLVITDGIVAVEGGGQRSVGQPVTGVHTWRNTGLSTNTSGLALLDETSPALLAFSGEGVLLTTELVLVDNEPVLLAFAHGPA